MNRAALTAEFDRAVSNIVGMTPEKLHAVKARLAASHGLTVEAVDDALTTRDIERGMRK